MTQLSPITTFSKDFHFLSNFYLIDIEFEGIVYPSTEHAFQAAKSLDESHRIRVKNQITPGLAKKEGRNLPLRPDWEFVKIQIMKEILHIKFSTPILRQRLLATENRELVEGNYWNDIFWGVCNGEGQNMLGKLLMEIREELRNM